MTFTDTKKSLRLRAEAMLQDLPDKFNDLTRKDVHTLIEELSVHQIELELQNEELLNTQVQLEENRHRYIRLFNEAPVGYVTLNSSGTIQHFNNTFAKMVPGFGSRLSRMAFADLMVNEDGQAFRARYKAFYKSPGGKQISARLSPMATGKKEMPGGYHVQLEAAHTNGETGFKVSSPQEFMLTVTETNELTRTQHKLEEALKDKETVITELQIALSNVKKLSGLLPICSHCKKIRDDKGYWNQIEAYIHSHSEAEFSHSICQECAKIHYPDYDIYPDDSQ